MGHQATSNSTERNLRRQVPSNKEDENKGGKRHLRKPVIPNRRQATGRNNSVSPVHVPGHGPTNAKPPDRKPGGGGQFLLPILRKKKNRGARIPDITPVAEPTKKTRGARIPDSRCLAYRKTRGGRIPDSLLRNKRTSIGYPTYVEQANRDVHVRNPMSLLNTVASNRAASVPLSHATQCVSFLVLSYSSSSMDSKESKLVKKLSLSAHVTAAVILPPVKRPILSAHVHDCFFGFADASKEEHFTMLKAKARIPVLRSIGLVMGAAAIYRAWHSDDWSHNPLGSILLDPGAPQSFVTLLIPLISNGTWRWLEPTVVTCSVLRFVSLSSWLLCDPASTLSVVQWWSGPLASMGSFICFSLFVAAANFMSNARFKYGLLSALAWMSMAPVIAHYSSTGLQAWPLVMSMMTLVSLHLLDERKARSIFLDLFYPTTESQSAATAAPTSDGDTKPYDDMRAGVPLEIGVGLSILHQLSGRGGSCELTLPVASVSGGATQEGDRGAAHIGLAGCVYDEQLRATQSDDNSNPYDDMSDAELQELIKRVRGPASAGPLRSAVARDLSPPYPQPHTGHLPALTAHNCTSSVPPGRPRGAGVTNPSNTASCGPPGRPRCAGGPNPSSLVKFLCSGSMPLHRAHQVKRFITNRMRQISEVSELIASIIRQIPEVSGLIVERIKQLPEFLGLIVVSAMKISKVLFVLRRVILLAAFFCMACMWYAAMPYMLAISIVCDQVLMRKSSPVKRDFFKKCDQVLMRKSSKSVTKS
eukprot:gene6497-3135_t